MMIIRRHLLPFGFYLLLALALTWPLALHLNAGFIGAPESDAYEYARHMWWHGEALRTGAPVYAHPTLAHPDGLPGAWLWAIPFQSFPAWVLALVVQLPVAYNVQALLWLALNGWALYTLARRLLAGHAGAAPAALVAGTAFALYPAVQGHLFASHLGIIALWPVPLYVVGLLALAGRGGAARILATAGFFVLALLGSTMTLVYVLAPLTLAVFGGALAARNGRGLLRMGVAVALGALLASAFVVPALVEQLTDPSAVRPAGVVRFSADLLAFASPSFFAPHAPPWSSRVIGTNIVEGYGYVGLVAGALALAGLWRFPAARPWGYAALGAWVLSLGPVLKVLDAPLGLTVDGRATFIPLPFALLAELPVLDITRTPGRFNLAVGFAVALLAGYGVAALGERLRRQAVRWGVAVALAVLVAADYQLVWGGFPTVPAAVPAAIAALREDASVRAVLNLPHDNLLVAKAAMYLQTAHGKPLVGGFVSRETPVPYAKRELLAWALDPALLDAAEVDVVIVFREAAPDLYDHWRAGVGAPFYEDATLAAFRAPATAAPPGFVARAGGNAAQVHAPEGTWATLTGTVPDEARPLVVMLDGEPVRAAAPGADGALSVAVPVPAGYHTVALGLAEPCPRYSPSPLLTCAPLVAGALRLEPLTAFGLRGVARFGDTITLREAAVTADADTVRVHLWWGFAAPPGAGAVRFVHLVGVDGAQVVGDDTPLTTGAGGYVETVTFARPAAAVRVYAGWYTFPSLARLPVAGDVPGAADGWAQVGAVAAPP